MGVQANVALGDTMAAVVAASDEMAMIKKTGDKKALAKVLDILGRVQVTRGDSLQALDLFTELLALQKELGDKKGEATALRLIAEQNLALSRAKAAMKNADDALKMFQDLGSEEGEDDANRAIRRICAARGLPEKAPNRAAAKAALQDLCTAIDNKDQAGWKTAMEQLQQTGAWTEKDMDEVTKKALEDSGSKAFLAEMGFGGQKKEATGEAILHEVIKRMTYIQFRIGGLGYGPRFRCLQAHSTRTKGLEGDDLLRNIKALAILQVSDEAEDWEKELGYQPGILDGMLQSLTALV